MTNELSPFRRDEFSVDGRTQSSRQEVSLQAHPLHALFKPLEMYQTDVGKSLPATKKDQQNSWQTAHAHLIAHDILIFKIYKGGVCLSVFVHCTYLTQKLLSRRR